MEHRQELPGAPPGALYAGGRPATAMLMLMLLYSFGLPLRYFVFLHLQCYKFRDFVVYINTIVLK